MEIIDRGASCEVVPSAIVARKCHQPTPHRNGQRAVAPRPGKSRRDQGGGEATMDGVSIVTTEQNDQFDRCSQATRAWFDDTHTFHHQPQRDSSINAVSATIVEWRESDPRVWTLTPLWTPRTRPQVAWESRPEREISTAPTPRIVLLKGRKNEEPQRASSNRLSTRRRYESTEAVG